MITCDPIGQIEVPGANYTFGDLTLALAIGDFDAMVHRGRPVIRIHLSGEPQQALSQLEETITKALKLTRHSQ